MSSSTIAENVLIAPANTSAARPARLTSLDVFRGATIAAMIVVNNPGNWDAVYPQLDHSEWHGCTFTDLVFPFFLWIVGVAMTFSFGKRIERGDSRAKLFLHTLRRAASIYGVGIVLTILTIFSHGKLGTTSPNEWRFGTLQMIATCYLLASIIFLLTTWRGQLAWAIGLMTVYWMMMALIPIPGVGRGSFEPQANVAHYLGKISHGWDIIGLGEFTAVATTLLGVLAGHILRSKKLQPTEKTAWMFFAGSVLLYLGWAMSGVLPLNKKLWTSSYTLFTAGLALLVFASCYWLIDVSGFRRWSKPFAIFGMNSLVLYSLSEIFIIIFRVIRVPHAGQSTSLQVVFYQSVFAPLMSPKNASLLWALFFLGVLYVIAWAMYRRKWFVAL